MYLKRITLLSFALAACTLRAAALVSLPVPDGLTELSGLTAGQRAPWWAINDSGDIPRLFRLGASGEDLGTVMVRGAENMDWEALACVQWQGHPHLLIGDVGDNGAGRYTGDLYLVPEPTPGAKSVSVVQFTQFQYPDGPRDVEAMAYDAHSNTVLLVTKRDSPPRLYAVPLQATTPEHALQAQFLGTVAHIPHAKGRDVWQNPIFGWVANWVTDMTISPRGDYLIIATYRDAYRYWRAPEMSWATALAQHPEVLPLPLLPQLEGIAVSADERSLMLGSEQKRGLVPYVLPVPAGR